MFKIEKIKKLLPLLIAIIFFTSFGLYHITKFETIDEHFWKYERVKSYYTGIKEGFTENNWNKTRINDKPGVTVALLSGMSLPFIPDPYQHEDFARESQYNFPTQKSPDEKIKNREMYVLYNVDQTEAINLGFRLPILLFNALVMLPMFFWLFKKAFGYRVASVSILLIGLNPILIGISQIPNPDSVFWSLSAAAIFSFFALLKTEQKKFIVLTGVFTGFSLLSKYTANLLFVFYPMIFIFYQIFNKKFDNEKEAGLDFPVVKKYTNNFVNFICNLTEKINKKLSVSLRKFLSIFTESSNFNYIISFISITLISWILFVLFMPEVIQTPKHFLYGTIYSPVLESFVNLFIDVLHIKKYLILSKGKYLTIRMAIFSFAIFSFLFVILPPLFSNLFKKFKKSFTSLLKIITLILSIIFLVSLVNAWTNASFFGLDDLKEISGSGEELTFTQFKNDIAPIFYFKALLIQAQNFVFSIHPIIFFITLLFPLILTFDKLIKKYSCKIIEENLAFIYFTLIIPFVFFVGGLLSNIFVNVRYSIMLYTAFSVLGTIGCLAILENIKISINKIYLKIFLSIIIIFSFSFSISLIFGLILNNLFYLIAIFLILIILFSLIFYKKFKNIKNEIKFIILVSIIIFTHSISLFNITPFLFNYTNFLLPKKFVVTDAWGYGFYEVAQYLNSLENAEDLVVWLDRSGVCQFFVGKCISSREVYLDHTDVDYLVITRRGSIIKKPKAITTNENHWFMQTDYYSEESLNNPEWEILIGDRPENFVKIINVSNPN